MYEKYYINKVALPCLVSLPVEQAVNIIELSSQCWPDCTPAAACLSPMLIKQRTFKPNFFFFFLCSSQYLHTDVFTLSTCFQFSMLGSYIDYLGVEHLFDSLFNSIKNEHIQTDFL